MEKKKFFFLLEEVLRGGRANSRRLGGLLGFALEDPK